MQTVQGLVRLTGMTNPLATNIPQPLPGTTPGVDDDRAHRPGVLADIGSGAIAGAAAGLVTTVAVAGVGVIGGAVLGGRPRELLVGLVVVVWIGLLVGVTVGAVGGAIVGALLNVTGMQDRARPVGAIAAVLPAAIVVPVLSLDVSSGPELAVIGLAVLMLPAVGFGAGAIFLRLRRSGARS